MPQASQSKFMPDETNRPALELLAAILAARSEPKKFTEFFHEDGVIHIIGTNRDYAFSGVYRGREQILSLLLRIDAEVEQGDHNILNVVVDGDNIAVRRMTSLRHHGTSAFTRIFVANLLRVRDGKIAEGYEYVDTSWLRRISGDDD